MERTGSLSFSRFHILIRNNNNYLFRILNTSRDRYHQEEEGDMILPLPVILVDLQMPLPMLYWQRL